MRVVTLMPMMPDGTRHLVYPLDGNFDCLVRMPGPAEVVRIGDPAPTGKPWGRVKQMRQLLRRERPDLLMTYNWGSIEWVLAGRLERIPMVHHEDGFGPEESAKMLKRRIWFRRGFLRHCEAVIVPSRNLFEIGRRHWKQPESRLRYLPNGVDLQRFAPADSPSERSHLVFGLVGRIRPEKNQALAVEAFSRARCRSRSRLRLVGDGSEMDAVRALAAERGVADLVDFIGDVRDTAPEYREIDVFVISSRTEQMPIALLEAMATALPVVGTNVGDVRSMVSEPNREWIGDLHSPDALASAFDRMAEDAAVRRELGAANRAKVESEFELDACFGAYIQLYLDVLKSRE